MPMQRVRLGPNMAVALVTTLYGLMLSYYVINPITDKVRQYLRQELAIQRLVIQGLGSIRRGLDAIFVEETLEVMTGTSGSKQVSSSRAA